MRPRHPALALLAAALGCVPEPVAWDEPRALAASGPAVAVALHVSGVVAAAGVDTAAAPPPGACPGSVREAAAAGQERYRVWWSPRADSSATLLAAHSSDGGVTWAHRYVVDSLDRGTRGCRRPAPAIAADSTNGYVHVTYALDAPEGPGLFYAHLMDPRAQFEVPAAVVYGQGSGGTAVASDDQHVAVAYEDPNSGRPRIALAVSRTAGHTFESKTIPVSAGDADAVAPAVAVRGGQLAVGWRAQGGGWMVRVGAVK